MIKYKGGTSYANEIWTAGTYYLTASFEPVNKDLTFDTTDGDIIIKANSKSILIDGTSNLFRIGSHRVIFTSINDDSVGEKIPGSTGIPARTDNALYFIGAGSLCTGNTIEIINTEMHFCSNQYGIVFLYHLNNLNVLTIDGLALYNCTVTTSGRCLIGHADDSFSVVATVSVKNVSVDQSNYVTSTGSSIISFVGIHASSEYRGIHVTLNNAFPCTAALRVGLRLGLGETVPIENILLVGTPTTGPLLRIVEQDNGTYIGPNTVALTYVILFGTSSATNGGLTFTGLYSPTANLSIRNSIFTGFTAPGNGYNAAIQLGGDVVLTENNNGFYNNHVNIAGRSIDASDITTDPDLGSLPPEVVMNSACPFPDGYLVLALTTYEERGDETFNASGFDEAVYTGTGKRYAGGEYTTPGIMYLVEPEAQSEILGAPTFVREPNWLYGVNLRYQFATAISLNRRATEQRRSLRNLPLRRTSFVVSGFSNKVEFENFVEQYRNQYVNIPIFSEPLSPTNIGSILGLGILTIREDCEERTNLFRYAAYVIIVDIRKQVSSELVKLDLAVGNQLILGETIAGSFVGEYTVVYPSLFSMIELYRVRDITDSVENVELTFREVR